jgi:hypothetical protein
LNCISEEKHLPWKAEDYENIVALSMLFDEFEEYRISNYLVLSNQATNTNVDLSKIQAKYTEMVSNKSQKINEFEYFKQLKESGFIGAKVYRVKSPLPDSAYTNVTKILTKPLELCFY